MIFQQDKSQVSVMETVTRNKQLKELPLGVLLEENCVESHFRPGIVSSNAYYERPDKGYQVDEKAFLDIGWTYNGKTEWDIMGGRRSYMRLTMKSIDNHIEKPVH